MKLYHVYIWNAEEQDGSEFVWAHSHHEAAELLGKHHGFDDLDSFEEVILTVTLIDFAPPAAAGLVPEKEQVAEAFEPKDLFGDEDDEEDE